MKILVISFFDDNFGDMLIRLCFDRLLHTAMKNLAVSTDKYTVNHIHIKDVCESDVASSNLVFFAGGAMFGINNLSTFENIDKITLAAQKYNVPVVFSSIGINNNRATKDSADTLNMILCRSCIKAMATREDASAFSDFTKGCNFTPITVCDPAVWTKHLYNEDINRAHSSKSRRVVGINFVRGGLFKANNHNWTLAKEEHLLNELRLLFEKSDIDYRFFTNGSILDNNSLSHFAKTFDIPKEKVFYPDNTKEVVSTIAGCDCVVAFRMHASIISYSLGVPSVNFIWNEKIPYFYKSIGYPERAIELEHTEPVKLFDHAIDLLNDKDYRPDSEYMMTLYHFLIDTLVQQLNLKRLEPYSFDKICSELLLIPTGHLDDITDYRTKLYRARIYYVKLFNKERKLHNTLRKTEAALKDKEQTIKSLQAQVTSLQAQLDYIYNKPIIKLYRKLRGSNK